MLQSLFSTGTLSAQRYCHPVSTSPVGMAEGKRDMTNHMLALKASAWKKAHIASPHRPLAKANPWPKMISRKGH